MTKSYRWCAVDGEGDVGEKGLLGVAIYSDELHAYLTDHDAARDALLTHARAGYTFLCHNASYDIPVVFGQLGLDPSYTYYNDRLHHGSWKYAKSKPAAQIWDTLDLSGGIPLEELGDALHLPKYKTPQRLRGFDPDRYEWLCELHERGECEECYAIRDAEIVYAFMTGLTTTLAGWGVEPAPRISGIAMNTWKALDDPAPIGLPSGSIRRLARAAYYGGRTECFKYGHLRPLNVADITSAYPAAMLETPMPDPSALIHIPHPTGAELPANCEGVATVDISVPPMHVPPLPHTMRGERVYPIGRLVGTWTLLELRYAVSLGCTINGVRELAYSTRSIFPFTNTISTLWALREAYKRSDDPRDLFAKLLMNNLYGRLGSRDLPEREIISPAPAGYDSRHDPKQRDGSFVGEQLYLSQHDTMRFGAEWTNVLWAAQITAAVRVKLHKLMLLQGIGIAYCDTDSVFSTEPIQGLSEGLGELEPEGQYQGAIIAQPKLYALQDFQGKWQPKAKGVRREVALAYLSGHSVTFKKPVKAKEGLRRGIAPGTWINVTKRRKAQLMKRQARNPAALSDPYGWTDTDPLVSGPIADYTQITGQD